MCRPCASYPDSAAGRWWDRHGAGINRPTLRRRATVARLLPPKSSARASHGVQRLTLRRPLDPRLVAKRQSAPGFAGQADRLDSLDQLAEDFPLALNVELAER